MSFILFENKGTDQQRCICAADWNLCFRHIDSTVSLLLKSEILFCGCADRFVSDLFGSPEDRFSHDAHHICALVIVHVNILWQVKTNISMVI